MPVVGRVSVSIERNQCCIVVESATLQRWLANGKTVVTANGDGITIVSFPLIWLSRRIIVFGNNREYDFQMSYQCLRRGHMDSAEFTEDFKAEKQIDGAKSYGENR